MGAADTTSWVVLGRAGDRIGAVHLDAAGVVVADERFASARLVDHVARTEGASSPRWVWHDTPAWYPRLLAAGVRIARCHDLRLSHAILGTAASVPAVASAPLRAAAAWDAPSAIDVVAAQATLFDLDEPARSVLPAGVDDAMAEFARQRDAVARSADPARLRLLLAAESAGALLAAEMRAAGLPWDAAAHDRILTDVLGERDATGVPAHLARAATRVRDALGDPSVSLDSQPKLLRALHRAGVAVESTSRWELAEQRHPVIEPLLEYKKLARLYSANGWAWLAEWVDDGRFRPLFVPGGVVTGRWASSGGGALQMPRHLREAVRADPGWKLVVADVAQLEPRVLAAMAGDLALAEAARGRDLYAGIVDAGTVATRQEAKIALLGAMYGATTGESGRLVPRLRRAYPRAMGLVDDAARLGEDGGRVSTWLGRSSPAVSDAWATAQARATESDTTAADVTRARRWARDRGRFTRNFVVQGTAAEWALAWLAELRTRLASFPPAAPEQRATRSGPVFEGVPHLTFFLHDEVIVHTPAECADEVAGAVRDAADAAGRLLFGGFPIDFALDVAVADTALKS